MLEWEENLFLGLKAFYQKVITKPRQRRLAVVKAALAPQRHALSLLGQMLAGRKLSLFETDDNLLCDTERIFLPSEFSIATNAEANAEFYRLKTVLGALAMRDGLTQGQENLLPELPQRHAAELPHLADRLLNFAATLPPEITPWSLLGRLPTVRQVPADKNFLTTEPEIGVAEDVTEISGQGQTEVTVLPPQDDDGTGADLPTHTFEKVETLEEHKGQSRKTDSEDELEEHEEALQSVKMHNLIRSPERPSSIYRSNVILDGLQLELDNGPAHGGIPYPEWDYRKRCYKPAWCHVNVSRPDHSDASWAQRMSQEHQGLIQRLKRQFALLANDWLRSRREFMGPEFDLDALVSYQTDVRSGHTPSEAIYVETKRQLHDLSTVILLDKSYSTAGYLANRCILQTIQATVFCVGEVMADYTTDFAIAGFASNTRRDCEFLLAKDFSDSWLQARSALGGMEAIGYTRIGPALRHAQELLHNRKASRKMILLITDGRPCDYDTYEGTYGINDIKQAISTGSQYGIQTHAIAIEKAAQDYFPQMFPGGHYSIVSQPEALAQVMTKWYGRMLIGGAG